MDFRDLKILYYVYVKNKLEYLKVISVDANMFYIKVNKLKIDEKNIPKTKKIHIKIESTKNSELPDSVKQGNYQCVSNLVDGVVFELNIGIYIIYRDPKFKIIQEYYSGPIPDYNIISYPLVVYYDDINLKSILERVKKSSMCLYNTHKQNYDKILNMFEHNFEELSYLVSTYLKNTKLALRRTEDDKMKLHNLRGQNKDFIQYNLKIRNDISRDIIDYNKLIDFNNKVKDLIVNINNVNDTVVNNYSNLGSFYYLKID